VGKSSGDRFLSNPNVLIEYGWALKEIGYSRIIPIMNTVFGEPSAINLPFDMRHLRHPLTYHLNEKETPDRRKKVKQNLIDDLYAALKLIIAQEFPDQKQLKVENYNPISFSVNPSTFLKPNEKFLDPTRFTDEYEYSLPNDENAFLRLIPKVPYKPIRTSKDALDLVKKGNLAPMSERGIGWLTGRNKYGAYAANIENHKVTNFTQLFKSGELWGIDTNLLNKKRLMSRASVGFGFFPCASIENTFNYTLANYLNFCEKILNLPLSLLLIAGVVNIEGYRMTSPSGERFNGVDIFAGHSVENNIIHKGVIDDYQKKPHLILRPFFEFIWNECGLDRPDRDSLGQII